ncbi:MULTISPECIES: YraN family protein [unclassified Leucobacter]|uniref:YraN family protein n=1 Tax=unclassified Leucobacter TaxID=2621730 RepID=UPI00165E0CA4|nr:MULTISPECIES: YraN family protein [unclassified Leucobacter]MBC9928034.1 YraN family protein [Leucobacter sp. cx-169]MBC9935509.1 YraN family protein [Leucobacter sp. cx-87]
MAQHSIGSPAVPQAVPRSRALGDHGEELAASYLEERGYQILARNWRIARGELDLVALDGDTIVAVEVKTRSGTGYGHPLEAITLQKAQRLRRLLLSWVRAEYPAAHALRIDAIGITVRPGERPRIDHLEGIS